MTDYTTYCDGEHDGPCGIECLGPLDLADPTEFQVMAEDPVYTTTCPYCDREENFDYEVTARAWLTGHIKVEHVDELPPFMNDAD